MKIRALPFEIAVSSPCQQSWGEMKGNVRERHCSSCDRVVHNLAAMTPREIEHLIARSGGHFCARVTKREDDSLVTLNNPQAQHRFMAAFGLAASFVVGTAGLSQSARKPKIGFVSGSLRDASGAGIPRAKIELMQSDSLVVFSRTNQEGLFRVEGPVGSYTLRATSAGFTSQSIPLILNEHEQSIAPLTLQLSSSFQMGVIVIADQRPWYKRIATKTMRLLHLWS